MFGSGDAEESRTRKLEQSESFIQQNFNVF